MTEAYHIIVQGITQADLKDDADYKLFAAFIRRAAERENLKVLAYLVMPDHVHCLLKPLAGQAEGAAAVEKWRAALQGFKPKLKECKIVRVRGRTRLMGLIRHLRLEPVRAGLVSDPGEYRWFGEDEDEQGASAETVIHTAGPRARYEPPRMGRETEKRLSALMVEVCRLTRVAPEQVRVPGANHRAREARQLFVFTARRFLEYPESAIAQFLGTTTPVIVRVLTATSYSLDDDPQRAAEWRRIAQTLHRSTIR